MVRIDYIPDLLKALNRAISDAEWNGLEDRADVLKRSARGLSEKLANGVFYEPNF